MFILARPRKDRDPATETRRTRAPPTNLRDNSSESDLWHPSDRNYPRPPPNTLSCTISEDSFHPPAPRAVISSAKPPADDICGPVSRYRGLFAVLDIWICGGLARDHIRAPLYVELAFKQSFSAQGEINF
ncbi:hypothetical protein TOPH_09219 [Tolypocladium ophioglossoides CBS 100239]|uniref:Uncharacterized protein n=1 Tax=Tolypocladium ophioglossoides (strain CBS 100239) TaxID=1163406 RepID=A0A0L0MWJ3_TOLOC|nr:hypothetical protein TOPH_09219 [Tolypocladium ophioglossoides CBS 100239]